MLPRYQFNKYKSGKFKWKQSLRKIGNESGLNINMTLINNNSGKVKWKRSLRKSGNGSGININMTLINNKS